MLDQPINNFASNADNAESQVNPEPYLDQNGNIHIGNIVIMPGNPAYKAYRTYIDTSIKNSIDRFPALLLTLGLELIVAFVIIYLFPKKYSASATLILKLNSLYLLNIS